MFRVQCLLLGLILVSVSFSQTKNSIQTNPFDYKWMDQQFPIDTLISFDNDTLVLSENQKYYVINFWFSSCMPCIAEIKWLNKLKEEYQSSELEFLAVTFEKKELVDTFLKNNQFEFQQFYIEEEKINENALAIGYPTTLILDKSGTVFFHKTGGYPDEEEAEAIYKILSLEIEKL